VRGCYAATVEIGPTIAGLDTSYGVVGSKLDGGYSHRDIVRSLRYPCGQDFANPAGGAGLPTVDSISQVFLGELGRFKNCSNRKLRLGRRCKRLHTRTEHSTSFVAAVILAVTPVG
jgi:hypothetical protein